MAETKRTTPRPKGKTLPERKNGRPSEGKQPSAQEIFAELVGQANDLPKDLSVRKFRVLSNL